MGTQLKLTKNQALVFKTLSETDKPLSAYTILEMLHDDGFRSPPQVYRALETLQNKGLVHRLESLNAFVACQHHDCQQNHLAAFAICDECSQVTELEQHHLSGPIKDLSKSSGFAPREANLEIHGTCKNCQETSH